MGVSGDDTALREGNSGAARDSHLPGAASLCVGRPQCAAPYEQPFAMGCSHVPGELACWGLRRRFELCRTWFRYHPTIANGYVGDHDESGHKHADSHRASAVV